MDGTNHRRWTAARRCDTAALAEPDERGVGDHHLDLGAADVDTDQHRFHRGAHHGAHHVELQRARLRAVTAGRRVENRLGMAAKVWGRAVARTLECAAVTASVIRFGTDGWRAVVADDFTY